MSTTPLEPGPDREPDGVPENPDPAGGPGWGEPLPGEDDPTHDDEPE